MLEAFGHAGIVGKAGMIVAAGTVAMAVAYAIRPTEHRLALIRPLTLATIFAALSASTGGAASVLSAISASGATVNWSAVASGAAETLTPLIGAFASLSVVWLLVAAGFRFRA